MCRCVCREGESVLPFTPSPRLLLSFLNIFSLSPTPSSLPPSLSVSHNSAYGYQGGAQPPYNGGGGGGGGWANHHHQQQQQQPQQHQQQEPQGFDANELQVCISVCACPPSLPLSLPPCPPCVLPSVWISTHPSFPPSLPPSLPPLPLSPPSGARGRHD